MSVNIDKSKVVHFRGPSVARTNKVFVLGDNKIEIVPHYTYLGLLFTEFLDYDNMAKAVAKSASRALGLLIVKSKASGGFHYNTYTKLFDTKVGSVIEYGAAIWGFKSFSCINAGQNRAMRFLMGVNKYAPNDAIFGDMAWKPVYINQWNCIFRHWSRCVKRKGLILRFLDGLLIVLV